MDVLPDNEPSSRRKRDGDEDGTLDPKRQRISPNDDSGNASSSIPTGSGRPQRPAPPKPRDRGREDVESEAQVPRQLTPVSPDSLDRRGGFQGYRPKRSESGQSPAVRRLSATSPTPILPNPHRLPERQPRPRTVAESSSVPPAPAPAAAGSPSRGSGVRDVPAASPMPAPVQPSTTPLRPPRPPRTRAADYMSQAGGASSNPGAACGGGGSGGGGDDSPSSSSSGSSGSPFSPDRPPPIRPPLGQPPRFVQPVTDESIMADWVKLENLIEKFVEECLPPALPVQFRGERSDSWAVLISLSDTAHLMLSRTTHAKYVFQTYIWSYLSREILGKDSRAWAGRDLAGDNGGGMFIGDSVAWITDEFIRQNERSKSLTQRKEFLRWRADTVRFVYNHVVTHERYQLEIDTIVVNIIHFFQPYFAAGLDDRSNQSWGTLIDRVTEIVTKAGELDLQMRKGDGVFEVFFKKDGDACMDARGLLSIVKHKADVALPERSLTGRFRASSVVSLTVVPGLFKRKVLDNNDGMDGSRVERVVARACQVFADYTRWDFIGVGV